MTDQPPDVLPYRRAPCDECPWRRDAPPGRFPAERFAALRRSSVGQFGIVMPDVPMFGCHKGTPGDPAQDLACAGWLAIAGGDHLAVRIAIRDGRLPAEALDPGPRWPALYESYDAMAAAMGSPDLPDTCTTDTNGDEA